MNFIITLVTNIKSSSKLGGGSGVNAAMVDELTNRLDSTDVHVINLGVNKVEK